jgi:RimJ/RimL family protein N-acetyltransferase
MVLNRGKRLVLRDMALKDLEVWGYWMGPGHEWQTLDGPYYRDDLSEQQVQDMITKRRELLSGDPEFPPLRKRAAIALIDTDAFIGQVTRYWISQETNWTAIGITIYDPENWGKGYGYEALGQWSEYLFENEPAFVRLDMRTWSGNIGLMRVAEKLGYRQEACFRKARIVEGTYYDGLGYGILREEWTARYPDGFAASL